MWELAKILQKTDEAGNVTVWGLSSAGWDNRSLFSIMRDLGRMWWDPDAKKFYLDSEEAIEALQFLVVKPVFELKIETELGMAQMNAALAGKVALNRGNVSVAGEAEKVGIPMENVIAPPARPGREPLFVGEGGWGFEVPVQAKNKDVGIEFLQFMCTYEAQYIFSGIYGGAMPAVKKVADSDIYQGDSPVKRGMRRALRAQKNMVYYGWGFGIPSEMERITSTAIEQVRTGELTAPEAAKQMQEQMEEHYKLWLEGKVEIGGS
jgi:ABC-type glycerol-3-phosphate transport system substrate-binding protein